MVLQLSKQAMAAEPAAPPPPARRREPPEPRFFWGDHYAPTAERGDAEEKEEKKGEWKKSAVPCTVV